MITGAGKKGGGVRKNAIMNGLYKPADLSFYLSLFFLFAHLEFPNEFLYI
jgi:hypothetical protein